MCGLFGFIGPKTNDLIPSLMRLISATSERGNDSLGIGIYTRRPMTLTLRYPNGLPEEDELYSDMHDTLMQLPDLTPITIIGNVRAEPTTEWIDHKSTADTHPFVGGDWAVVHNGMIANDKELETQGYVKAGGSKIDSAIIPHVLKGTIDGSGFAQRIRKIKGSYALLGINVAHDPEMVFAACNYKPLYHVKDHNSSMWFSSSDRYLRLMGVQFDNAPEQVPPYFLAVFKGPWKIDNRPLLSVEDTPRPKGLIVCSGGLDSTVVAKHAVEELGRDNVRLLHFAYACRAQFREVSATMSVSKRLGIPHTPDVINVERLFKRIAAKAPLLNDTRSAQGDAGAEYAYEWVPARNLIFLSLATAIAETDGITRIYLGTNLEEAGAYPDNEPEFIHKFNDLLPFAIADTSKVVVRMPVGHMMKHEIVKYGLEIEAPLDITWSCYDGDELHCGTCGPCRMRRVAFEMNNAKDPVVYAS